MHQHSFTVSSAQSQPGQFHDRLAPLSMWARALRCDQRIEPISEHLRVERRAGRFSDVDFVILAVCLFATSSQTWSQLDGVLSAHRQQCAMLVGRCTLPSMSAASRYLSVVDDSDATALASWLLNEHSPIGASQHEAAALRDADGQLWQLFDWDTSKLALRLRALPEGYDLPKARRLADKLARAAYSGRKRGSMVASYSVVQHAGSTQWVGARVFKGAGTHEALVEHAVTSVETAALHQGWPLQRALLRADGEMRTVCFVRRVTQTPMHYLTRCDRYHLLKRPDVWQRLQAAPWQDVEDSGSGPRRQACELGFYQLAADIEPQRCRLVVSRYRADKKRGAGHLRAGYVYELYLCDLDARSWPAPDVVWLYYGRGGFENQLNALYRFAPALLHVLSYNPAGQALMLAVAMWLCNLALQLGLDLHGELDEAPAAEPRPQLSALDTAGHHLAHRLDTLDALADALEPVALESEPVAIQEGLNTALALETESLGGAGGVEPVSNQPLPATRTLSPEPYLDAIRALDWTALLSTRVNLVGFDAQTLAARCQAGHQLDFDGVRQATSSGRVWARWRGAQSQCNHCPLRVTCQGSGRARYFRREINLTLSGGSAPPPSPMPPPPSPDSAHHRAPAQRGTLYAPQPVGEGRWLSMPSWLYGCDLRRRALEALGGVRVAVFTTTRTGDPQPQARSRHDEIARRQRRRRSWPQRHRRNQLPAHVDVHVTIYGHDPLPMYRTGPGAS